jgi:hypothetical protein
MGFGWHLMIGNPDEGVRPKIWESAGGRGGSPPDSPWFAQLPKNWDAPSMKEDVANYKKKRYNKN